MPAWHADGVVDIEEAEDGFVRTPEAKLNPSFTTMEGVFVAGVAAGPEGHPGRDRRGGRGGDGGGEPPRAHPVARRAACAPRRTRARKARRPGSELAGPDVGRAVGMTTRAGGREGAERAPGAAREAWRRLRGDEGVAEGPAGRAQGACGRPSRGAPAPCRTSRASAASRPRAVLWHLMAMRRYGEVTEAGERDRYVLYALKEGLRRWRRHVLPREPGLGEELAASAARPSTAASTAATAPRCAASPTGTRLSPARHPVPAARPRGAAPRVDGPLALLLLRPVLGDLPARGRARRADDGHPALADQPLRLDRPLAPALPREPAGRSACC